MALNAIPCDPAADSYLTLVEADERMTGFLQAAKWGALEDAAKETYLKAGSRIIGQYRATWPPKQQSAQALPFPTSKDVSEQIPLEVKNAVLEWIDYRLEGKRITLKEQQAEGVTSASLLGQSKSFNADPSGLPAGARRELDKLLASYEEIDLGGVRSCRCIGLCRCSV